MGLRVAVFTDTYHPTINGVTYVVDTWARYWNDNHGRMEVVYPDASDYTSQLNEHPIPSIPFPFYKGYRIGFPWIPAAVRDVDIVHIHSVYSVGVAGAALSRALGVPLVASYHTDMSEYSNYVAPTRSAARVLGRALNRYERFTLRQADSIIVPSETMQNRLKTRISGDMPITALSNGVDTNRFGPRPEAAARFRESHNLKDTIVGYTGRHGTEKQLEDLIAAVDRLNRDVTLILGGEGPATSKLRRRAAKATADVRFLGFLDRETLPAFYAALDVFGFPSPVETEGIVAMEAIASGTPVVGVDAGALSETITHGQTGYLFPRNDRQAFAEYIETALVENERLRDACLDTRVTLDVRSTLIELRTLYETLLDGRGSNGQG